MDISKIMMESSIWGYFLLMKNRKELLEELLTNLLQKCKSFDDVAVLTVEMKNADLSIKRGQL